MTDQVKPPNIGQDNSQWLMGSVFATLLLIAIESYFFLPAISNDGSVFPLAVQNPQVSYTFSFLFPSNLGSLALFLLIPVVYCSFASVWSRPKKLVNPIIVQGGVMVVVGLALIFRLATANSNLLQSASLTGVLLAVVMVSTILVILIGMIQWSIVTWVIRMNYESSDEKSFVINLKTKAILHKLGSSFLDDFNFSRQCDLGDIWVLKRQDGNFRWLLIEIGPHPEDGNKSILATVAYEYQRDWIVKSDSASNVRDWIIKNTEERLGLEFTKNPADSGNPVSRLAIGNVKDLGRSRIEVTWGFLRGISRFYQTAIGLTVALLFALSVVYFNFSQSINFSSDSYIVTTVALIIALIVEIGLPLREELNKKKREELEF